MAEPGSAVDEANRAKEAAGRRAADLVRDGMHVGLGTGSTVTHTIVALGERFGSDSGAGRGQQDGIGCVPTSDRTEELARRLGLRVVGPGDVARLDVCIDGADEVDTDLNLVKGGGGAHAREKIVAAMAEVFVVVADESKLVHRLGAFGVPVEVLEFGMEPVARRLHALGADEVTRRDGRSDNGNPILDAAFPPIDDPASLSTAISGVPGVIEHGIFPAAMVSRVVVAGVGGVRELERAL